MIVKFPLKVCVVDDDPIHNKMLIGMIGSNSKLEVHGFTDSKEAMEAISAKKFQIVITDINMPGIPGDELVKKIQALSGGMQVIVVTGADSLMTAIRCYNAGARYMMSKPVDKVDLVSAVDDCISHIEHYNGFIESIKAKKA